MSRRLSPPLIRSHLSRLIPRLSHSLSPPISRHPNPRLSFVHRDLDESQSLIPITPPGQGQVGQREDEEARGGAGDGTRVEISHPWPEWVDLLDCLVKRGYLDRTAFGGPSESKASNHIRTACLNFGRDHVDLIRYFSRRDIQIVVGSGCPSLDRKVVNSGKRLRSHVGIEEGDVCSSCNLRGSCERAYVKAHEDEGGRTVDVIRILLTYGLDAITGSVESPTCLTNDVKESVRKLLRQVVDLSGKEVNSNVQRSAGHQMAKGTVAVPMKQGDWICPKCNFVNFAKNINCLRCNGVFEERLKKLHEGCEHLPLKKGDWICEKCNFLNFAKNTRCLQCHEKPPKRQLNPGEWECISCNYINFRRNMMCLKCDWKRPKASASGDIVAEAQHGKQGHDKFEQICSSREEDVDLWCSDEDQSDVDLDTWHKFDEFDGFPIVGGKGATSRDPIARESWKEAMLKRRQGISESSVGDNRDLSFARFCDRELDEDSGEEEIAGWFRYESREGNGTMKK